MQEAIICCAPLASFAAYVTANLLSNNFWSCPILISENCITKYLFGFKILNCQFIDLQTDSLVIILCAK